MRHKLWQALRSREARAGAVIFVKKRLRLWQIIKHEVNILNIGQASKRECHELLADGTSPLHRAFSLFIFNEKGELLLQQRSDSKITFPSMWTNTCCSHPLMQGDEPDGVAGVKLAAQRRTTIELGIPESQLDVNKMQYLTR